MGSGESGESNNKLFASPGDSNLSSNKVTGLSRTEDRGREDMIQTLLRVISDKWDKEQLSHSRNTLGGVIL